MSGHDEDYVPLPAEDAGTRTLWVLFLAGPTIWLSHFLLVYALAEVLCKPLRTDARIAGLPLVSFLTVVATLAAAAAVVAFSARSFRRWQDTRDTNESSAVEEHGSGHGSALAFGGFLLGALFFVAVLFTGAPALWLQPC